MYQVGKPGFEVGPASSGLNFGGGTVALEKRELEEKRVRELLESALVSVREAMDSSLWSYTREYELGRLSVARSILDAEVKTLAPT